MFDYVYNKCVLPFLIMLLYQASHVRLSRSNVQSNISVLHVQQLND